MAERAVKQPNGLYARFSDVVDNFTHVNCTRDEVILTYLFDALERGMRDATAKVDRADADPGRLDSALRTVLNVHGSEVYEQARELILKGEAK